MDNTKCFQAFLKALSDFVILLMTHDATGIYQKIGLSILIPNMALIFGALFDDMKSIIKIAVCSVFSPETATLYGIKIDVSMQAI